MISIFNIIIKLLKFDNSPSFLILGIFVVSAMYFTPSYNVNFKSKVTTMLPSGNRVTVPINRQTPRDDKKILPKKPANSAEYPVHDGIITTVFWVGESANDSNANIHNRSSAWVTDWVGAFGGIDDPDNRCGSKPCGFNPKENPFYFALPFNDYSGALVKPTSELQMIPWFKAPPTPGQSLLKNRWISITFFGRTAYAQWEDVGPFGENDSQYVFLGGSPQNQRAGLDISPATADYLGIDGRAKVSWRFVDQSIIPAGPWTETISSSGISR